MSAAGPGCASFSGLTDQGPDPAPAGIGRRVRAASSACRQPRGLQLAAGSGVIAATVAEELCVHAPSWRCACSTIQAACERRLDVHGA